MSFTSFDKLQTDLNETQLIALVGDDHEDDDSAFALALAQVDALITSYTGVEPSEENNGTLVSIASKILIWNMTGKQAQLGEEELRRRKDHFDWAMDMLRTTDWHAFLDLDDDDDDENTGPATGTDAPRVSTW